MGRAAHAGVAITLRLQHEGCMAERMSDRHYDLVVVGAGVVGLMTAYAARLRGLKVAVVERTAQSIGASIRNFGFITVTGQRRGEHWRRAMKTRDAWLAIAPQAGIPVIHAGLYLTAQRPEALAVIEAFLRTEMGEGCELLTPAQTQSRYAGAPLGAHLGALYSPHERRVESREAIPKLAAWLQAAQGVDFYWRTVVHGVDLPAVATSRGVLRADHCVVCPGHELNTLYPDFIEQAGIRMSTLQMLRVRPASPIHLPAALMSDLSLVRYDGYSELPEAAPLLKRLEAEQGEHLKQGVHLIVVQSADGTLVVGDSHVYGDAEAPFGSTALDDLILDELQRVLPLPGATVTERWTGTYASAADVVFKAPPSKGVALGIVTGGTGASTSYAFAEELLALALNS
jgi:FAD dependent oxidoreductase TIGR03364